MDCIDKDAGRGGKTEKHSHDGNVWLMVTTGESWGSDWQGEHMRSWGC